MSVLLRACSSSSEQRPPWQCCSMNVRIDSSSPPRPRQFPEGKHHNTSNQKQEDRDSQVGLLLEFLEPFIDPRRSPIEHCTKKQKPRDGGGNEGYDLENHSSQ